MYCICTAVHFLLILYSGRCCVSEEIEWHQRQMVNVHSTMVSLYLIPCDLDCWCFEREGDSLVHDKVHVDRIDDVVRYQHQVLVHFDELRKGARGEETCGRASRTG